MERWRDQSQSSSWSDQRPRWHRRLALLGPPGSQLARQHMPRHVLLSASQLAPPGGWGGMCGGWSKGSLWDRSYPILVLERTGSRKRDWLGSTWYHLAPLSCSFLETRPYGYFRHICASDTDCVLHAWSEGRGPKRCRGLGEGPASCLNDNGDIVQRGSGLVFGNYKIHSTIHHTDPATTTKKKDKRLNSSEVIPSGQTTFYMTA